MVRRRTVPCAWHAHHTACVSACPVLERGPRRALALRLSRRPSLFIFLLRSCALSHARAVFVEDSPNMPEMANQELREDLDTMLLGVKKLPSYSTISKNSSKCACCALPHAAAHSP